MLARGFLGADVDLDEAYDWGWDELGRIEADMVGECAQIRPGASIDETVAWLETESDLVVEGEDALRAWLQELMDTAIADLDGTHFDIAPPVRRVEAMIAPPGGAAAMYYTGPRRTSPGPVAPGTRRPASSASRCGARSPPRTTRACPAITCRSPRSCCSASTSPGCSAWASSPATARAGPSTPSGSMDELGYLDRPEYRLGMLAAQALRAVRVIIDIGMHLELEIPADQPPTEAPFHPGERWTPDLGRAFLYHRSRHPESFMASEIVRYLGWPGQAISYKIGERVWLEARADARARHGAAFDLKAFHAYALDLGPLGLDLLRTELARF